MTYGSESECATHYTTAPHKGVKRGAETAAHAARCYINKLSPEEAFLKIDFTNAFNAVSRDEIFSSSEEYTPELLPFINICYGQPYFLIYGESVILSEQGLQQGDVGTDVLLRVNSEVKCKVL